MACAASTWEAYTCGRSGALPPSSRNAATGHIAACLPMPPEPTPRALALCFFLSPCRLAIAPQAVPIQVAGGGMAALASELRNCASELFRRPGELRSAGIIWFMSQDAAEPTRHVMPPSAAFPDPHSLARCRHDLLQVPSVSVNWTACWRRQPAAQRSSSGLLPSWAKPPRCGCCGTSRWLAWRQTVLLS